MIIKKQNFSIESGEFEFSLDAEFEIEISLEQACFANCLLIASGWVNAEDRLYPYCATYKIRTESGAEKKVSLDPTLRVLIEFQIDHLFRDQFEAHCEEF